MPTTIISVLEKLKEAIPVEWDRFTKTDDGFYVVYGWIARTDGQRDFVLFEMWDYERPENVFCTTSSAKYSEEIGRILYGSADGHNPCRKIDELFASSTFLNEATVNYSAIRLARAKTNDLFENLETFIDNLSKTLQASTDTDEITILSPILETAQSLKDQMEPIL